jgi:hypothetical protein
MIAWWVVASAWAADTAHLDQARLFYRRGWYADAESELETALSSPEAADAREIHALLAQVRLQRCDIEGARKSAAQALRLSQIEGDVAAASAFVDFLDAQFGRVVVRSRQEGLRSHVRIEPLDPVYDAELQAYTHRIQAQLERAVDLPLTLHLPVGRWQINGHEVTIATTGTTEQVLETSGIGGLWQTLELDLGFGLGAWFGPDVRGQFPAPSFEAALRVPVGPIAVSGLFDVEPRRYLRDDGTIAPAVTAGMLGAKVGVEAPGVSSLVVRGAAGYRVGTVPGVSTHTFGPADGVAHVPFLEVSITDFAQRRNKGVGFGVTLTGERAFGTVASGSEAGYTSEDVRWSATGARLLFHIALAP